MGVKLSHFGGGQVIPLWWGLSYPILVGVKLSHFGGGQVIPFILFICFVLLFVCSLSLFFSPFCVVVFLPV